MKLGQAWEQFSEQLDLLITEGIEQSNAAEKIAAARPAFHHLTGEPFADETGFERRDQAFYEWYLFDYQDGNAASAMSRSTDTLVQQTASDLADVHVAVGSIKPVGDHQVTFQSWCDGAKRELIVATTAGLEKHEAMVTRYFVCPAGQFVSPASEVIPSDISKELKRQLKWLATEDTTDREMWASAMRFQLVAHRYNSAGAKEVVERWIHLEQAKFEGNDAS